MTRDCFTLYTLVLLYVPQFGTVCFATCTDTLVCMLQLLIPHDIQHAFMIHMKISYLLFTSLPHFDTGARARHAPHHNCIIFCFSRVIKLTRRLSSMKSDLTFSRPEKLQGTADSTFTCSAVRGSR